MRAFLLAVLGLGMMACSLQTPPDVHAPSPMPYQFRITKFVDERDVDVDVRYDMPFPQEYFLREVQSHLRANLFDSRPAKLRLALTHYGITNFKQDFTLSLAVKMEAVSDLGKSFLTQEFHCAQDHYGSALDVKTLAENVLHNPHAFTKAGWRDKVETELLEQCVDEIMLAFSRAVVSATPLDDE